MAAGDTHPSMRLPYTDPESGRSAVRLTTDGNTVSGFRAANYLQDMSGEQSRSSAWAPDSIHICYAKGVISGTTKQAGIYKMNTDTGVETQLVALSNPFLAYPTWSRAGSSEVYYMDTSGANTRLRAVLTDAPYTVRTIAQVNASGSRQKVTVNSDGTLIAFHVQATAGAQYKTIIANRDGSGILTGWGISGPNSADGSFWHPTQPRQIAASRGNGAASVRLYNVDTLAPIHTTNFRSSHAAVHPDGTRIYQIDSGTYRNFNTGAQIYTKGGTGSIHPHFSPADSGLGDNARILGDEAAFFFNPYERPALWVFTPAQAQTAPASGITQSNPHRAGEEAFQHWSRSANNSSHPHPQFSPNGLRVLWVSDKDSKGGVNSPAAWSASHSMPAAAGPTGGSEDLFMGLLHTAVTTTTSLTSAPNPSGSGQSVDLTATVEPIGGGVAGTVAFVSDLDGTLGASVAVTAGIAVKTTSALTVGTHNIVATFTPTDPADFTSSVSSAHVHVVQPPPPEETTTTITYDDADAIVDFGTMVTITATVTANVGTPTGSVEFFDGGVSIGTDTLTAGVGTLDTNTLVVGIHNISAVYTPTDATAFSASTSTEEQLTIEGVRVTNVFLDVQPGSPQVVNITLTLTATVAVVSIE